jgi:hypothetical protein
LGNNIYYESYFIKVVETPDVPDTHISMYRHRRYLRGDKDNITPPKGQNPSLAIDPSINIYWLLITCKKSNLKE